jgi:hypothetical protein
VTGNLYVRLGDRTVLHEPAGHETGGFLIPSELWTGYYLPLTRRERLRNIFLSLLRRPIPAPRWKPGLEELLEKQEVRR